MTRLTDGTKTVEITMSHWTGCGYSPDWSNDFFEVGGLEIADDDVTYIVTDVDYCVACAQDWGKGQWDGDDDAAPEEIESRCATVEFC